MSNLILQQLDKYEFHDMVVNSIDINLKKSPQIIINALPFNELIQGYEKLKVKFLNIIEIKIDSLLIDKNLEIEISSFDYSFHDFFECKIVFLLGFAGPGLTINIKCKKIELEEPISLV